MGTCALTAIYVCVYIYIYILSNGKKLLLLSSTSLQHKHPAHLFSAFSLTSLLNAFKQSIYSRKLVVSHSFTMRNSSLTSDPEFLPVTYTAKKELALTQLSGFDSGTKTFQGRSYLSKRQSHTQGNISDLKLIECEIKGCEWLLKGNQIYFYGVAVQMVSVMGCGRTKGS